MDRVYIARGFDGREKFVPSSDVNWLVSGRSSESASYSLLTFLNLHGFRELWCVEYDLESQSRTLIASSPFVNRRRNLVSV